MDEHFYMLIQQMKTYHYDEKTGKPVKFNDDCVHSMLCAMKTSLPGGLIEIVGARRRP
jgi:hypothetical protein